MTDPVTITTLIIAAIPSTIASIVSAFIVFKSSGVTKQSNAIAKSTHELVNGSMLYQLQLHANTARILVNLSNTPENNALYELAEKTLEEHQAKRSKLMEQWKGENEI